MANTMTCPSCKGSGDAETIHYDESGYGNPPQRTLERCPTCNGEGEVVIPKVVWMDAATGEVKERP